MRGKVRPVIGHAKLPLILIAFNASTGGDGPFARLMQEAKALEKAPGVLSTSLFFVGSYLDMPDMGCSSLVVTDGDAERAVRSLAVLGVREVRSRNGTAVAKTAAS